MGSGTTWDLCQCSKAERLTLSQMFFVEVQISCRIQTFKPVLLDAMFLSWIGVCVGGGGTGMVIWAREGVPSVSQSEKYCM